MSSPDRRTTAVAVRPLTAADQPPPPRSSVTLTLGVLVVVVAVGFALGRIAAPAVHNKMWPWVVGRGIGIAAYIALSALTAAGLWTRHPLRQRAGVGNPATWLHVHAALAAATLVLTGTHIVVLALDKYAGVGWIGAFVPGRSTYRPLAVAFGSIGVYIALVVGGTAALAGYLFRRSWRPLHYFALASFASICAHGVLAGSDTTALRPVYIGTGLFVGLLAASRWTVPSGIGAPTRVVR
ncbi:MAG: hypothetical protein QOG52_787 [Frankiaceae bacterium]|nr:hypothetical protein [Frankiaceae bacterium]